LKRHITLNRKARVVLVAVLAVPGVVYKERMTPCLA